LLSLLTPAGWVAACALVALLAWVVSYAPGEHPVHAVTLTLLAGTLVTHAVFFGEPRFALVTYPWILAIAGLEVPQLARPAPWGTLSPCARSRSPSPIPPS
jgi:hypothetical protein